MILFQIFGHASKVLDKLFHCHPISYTNKGNLTMCEDKTLEFYSQEHLSNV